MLVLEFDSTIEPVVNISLLCTYKPYGQTDRIGVVCRVCCTETQHSIEIGVAEHGANMRR
jgi:hypothetical protein